MSEVPRRDCRAEITTRVAIAPDGTVPTKQAIDREREQHREPLHAAPEELPIHRFHDEVNVIFLDAEVNDLEAVAFGGGDSLSDGAEDSLLSKAG